MYFLYFGVAGHYRGVVNPDILYELGGDNKLVNTFIYTVSILA